MGYKRRYYENINKTVDGYNLEITSAGTVFHREETGTLRKLTSWQRGGKLFLALPNEKIFYVFLEGNELKVMEIGKEEKGNENEEN